MAENIIRQIAELPIHATALTKHTMNRAPLKVARHIGTYLFRYADDWSFSGDTWHSNLGEALDQAKWEFSVDPLDWRPITEAQLVEFTNQKQAAALHPFIAVVQVKPVGLTPTLTLNIK